jgi:hypothetical protein
MGLAIPNPTPTSFGAPLALMPRADTDFVTKYDLFDSSTSEQDGVPSDDSPRLKPIQDVFLAMTQGTAPNSPGQGGQGEIPTPTLAFIEVTPLATSPPMGGPGVVILSSSRFPAILEASPTPSPSPATTVSDSATTHIISTSTRVLVIASVIGGILSIALCLFLFFDPTLREKLSGIFGCRKRKDPKYAKGISSSDDKGSIDQPSSPQPDHTLVEKSPSPSKRENGGDETLLDNVVSPVTPPSKFSVYSSEYRRASILAGESNQGRIKPTGAVTFASPPKSPSRPPRPPTADSPTLSDSVYLALSNQPYVIVAPQPLTEADMNSGTDRKRMLTPSEFFALHVPGALANLHISKSDRTSKALDRQGSATGTRESQHARTKSTPLMNGSRTAIGSRADEDSGEDNEALAGPIAHKVTKHRRSRSASGWAYPDRPKPKKVFVSGGI